MSESMFESLFGFSKKPAEAPVADSVPLTNGEVFGDLSPIHQRISDAEWGSNQNGLPDSWQLTTDQ
jgi:hypothetical protein